MDLAIRLGITLGIILVGIGLYRIVGELRLVALRNAQRHRSIPGLDDFRIGVPSILYFTTPDCIPCRTVQGQAIEELCAQFGEHLQIIKVDASERTDLANQWGVLSVPTTFILDGQGQPRHVNNGVTSATKLRQQLCEFVGLSKPNDSAKPITSSQLAARDG